MNVAYGRARCWGRLARGAGGGVIASGRMGRRPRAEDLCPAPVLSGLIVFDVADLTGCAPEPDDLGIGYVPHGLEIFPTSPSRRTCAGVSAAKSGRGGSERGPPYDVFGCFPSSPAPGAQGCRAVWASTQRLARVLLALPKTSDDEPPRASSRRDQPIADPRAHQGARQRRPPLGAIPRIACAWPALTRSCSRADGRGGTPTCARPGGTPDGLSTCT